MRTRPVCSSPTYCKINQTQRIERRRPDGRFSVPNTATSRRTLALHPDTGDRIDGRVLPRGASAPTSTPESRRGGRADRSKTYPSRLWVHAAHPSGLSANRKTKLLRGYPYNISTPPATPCRDPRQHRRNPKAPCACTLLHTHTCLRLAPLDRP